MSNGQRVIGKEAIIPAHLDPIKLAIPVKNKTNATTNTTRKTPVKSVIFLGLAIEFVSIGMYLKNKTENINPPKNITKLDIKVTSTREIP